jgi:hypothetical protein
MERKKDYQLDDIIFELAVWVCIIVIVYIDIKETF